MTMIYNINAQCTTNESDLMIQIHRQLESSYSTDMTSTTTGTSEHDTSAQPHSADSWDHLHEADEYSLLFFDDGEHVDLADLPAEIPIIPPTVTSTSTTIPPAPVVSDDGLTKKLGRAKRKGTNGVDRAAAEANREKSVYDVGKTIQITDGVNVYLDPVPLAQSAKLNYKGTFTVYLDEQNKIFRYEFIFTTRDDATEPIIGISSSKPV